VTKEPAMPVFDPCVIRPFAPSGEPVVRLGVELLDDYLDFVAARPRPNKTTGSPSGDAANKKTA
jgi:hypothetical protein